MTQSDEQLLAVEVPGQFTGDSTVAAAVRLHRLDTQPRSLTFLAEIVRRGGVLYAANLPEPMPTPEQSALVRDWLGAGAGRDEAFARWLDAVALVLDARRSVRVNES
jgi:hypothetical protein